MSDNRVTITMTDGTTREVHEETPVRIDGGRTPFLAEYIHGGERVEVVFEPTREDWVPYEPWMRDVLADDAGVSYQNGGFEVRRAWEDFWEGASDEDHVRNGLRIHPDDVPERPTEDHVALRVAIIDEWAGRPDSHFNLADAAARVAREHIEDSLKVYYRDLYEKAEAEAEDNARRETTQRNRADAWEARHAALREDVERTRGINAGAELTFADEVIRGILDRDDERGERA